MNDYLPQINTGSSACDFEAMERAWREWVVKLNYEIMAQIAREDGLPYIPIERPDVRVEREMRK